MNFQTLKIKTKNIMENLKQTRKIILKDKRLRIINPIPTPPHLDIEIKKNYFNK